MLAKKLKTALVGWGVLGAAVFAASSAFAGPVALPGGGVNVKLSGVEEYSGGSTGLLNGNTCPGCGASPLGGGFPANAVPAYNGTQSVATGQEGAWGVFVVDSLAPANPAIAHDELSTAGANFFSNGGGGSTFGNQIVGIFYGIQNTGVGTGQYGVFDLYWWDSNNQSQFSSEASGGRSLRNNTSATSVYGSGYTGYTCAPSTPGCTFLAEFDLVPGNFFGGGGPNTLFSAINIGTTAGAGYFEAEIDLSKGGAWAAQLANDYFQFTNPATGGLAFPLSDFSDLNGQQNNSPCTLAGVSCPGWALDPSSVGIQTSDPAQVFTRVPEPGTLSLFGMGLLGLGFLAKRRKSKESKA